MEIERMEFEVGKINNGNLDTSTATGQVDAFVLTNTGLMAGASLEGTKVTRLTSL